MNRAKKKFFHGLYLVQSTDIPSHVRRKQLLLFTLGCLAVLLLASYGTYDFIKGFSTTGTIALTIAAILTLNNLHALKFGRFNINIVVSVISVSILFALLYWRGFSPNIHFVWYLAFPGFAAFTLGAKRGMIGMMVMILPILISGLVGHKVDFIADYSLTFELRFLGIYILMSYQAILLQNNVEVNFREVQLSNQELEREVAKRTSELGEKIQLLDDEVQGRINVESKLRQTLNEKDILLKEVHHRTKNNMSVIIALLYLQKRELSVENIEGIFNRVADRIHSMAMVHEQLYQNEDVSTIELSLYVRELVQHLERSQGDRFSKTDVEIDSDDIKIGLGEAIPLGLALNEIMTNSFKHANPAGNHLQFNISIKACANDMIQLNISDNGQGFPADFDPEKASSLGLHLTHMLIKDQLDGTIEISRGANPKFKIDFPLFPTE